MRSTYVTRITKTRHNSTRTEIWFFAEHESHTLALSRNTIDRATYSIGSAFLLASCVWPCKPMTVHCGVYGATEVH